MQCSVKASGCSALFNFFFFFVIFSGILFSGCRQKPEGQAVAAPAKYTKTISEIQKGSLIEALQTESHWVDSVYNSLTPDERIAQLMIVEGYSNQGKKYEKDLLMLVKEYKVGGIIFFQGGPVRQAKLTNKLQAASKVPLMLSMDAESGVGMRLDSCVQYPLPMLLGAARNDTFAYKLGSEIAYEFQRLGMHINFAPVADVNNNPKNPVISFRSFGENKEIVTSKSIAYMRGMQDNNVMAVAKHFPGHGDTDVDSHFDLPVITFKRHRLDSLELYPFREMIRTGTGGIMVAHMNVPRLDTTTKLPASLSRPIVTDLLQLGLGFQGLIFTDAMVMKGVTKYFAPGVAEVKALQAGNDVLERLVSVPTALKEIKKAIARGDLSQEDLDRRCKKILKAKLWLGLNRTPHVELKNLQQDLTSANSRILNQQLAEASVTLLRNQNQTLPLNWSELRKKRTKVATLSFGAFKPTVFQKIAEDQIQAPAYTLARSKNKARELQKLRKNLKKYKLVIISIHGRGNQPSNNLGYGKAETALINELVKSGKAIVCFFDNAYALSQFEELQHARALLVGYQQLPAVQEATAKIVFGQLQPRGRLPVTVSSHFKYDAGLAYTQLPSVNSHPVMPALDKKAKKQFEKHRIKAKVARN
ncbi:glycoside hydrolase family 3 protein [Adhaeribacter soli]|uniref:beta-N-acetylhexosaminidase n=1 Tax=Adhaeribacter soli TaxID=2607655 RepID=A0A5N1J644_9BACT|nr:glycoside hydrolase family 3 N-terminal domain-containing protein [Adhaeribacter soli]KAA9340657.1 glycoside hydrolase family 3 [Adhaeribacter soli]